MHHHVCHTVPGRLLFTTWEEGFTLWNMLARAWPGVHAACLMPDHVHILHPAATSRAFGFAMSGYARWKVGRGAAPGPLVRSLPRPELVSGATKQRRSIRYVHLNPCRARLADDPLSWPLSTHLDAIGASLRPTRAAVPDPANFHGWVSSDPSVCPTGSEPLAHGVGVVELTRLLTATAAACRITEASVLEPRSPELRLFLGAARAMCEVPASTVADFAGVSSRSVRRAPLPPRQHQAVLRRLAADPRITPLDDGLLWQSILRYKRSRGF